MGWIEIGGKAARPVGHPLGEGVDGWEFRGDRGRFVIGIVEPTPPYRAPLPRGDLLRVVKLKVIEAGLF